MKRLIFLCTLCVIGRFIDGQGIMENDNGSGETFDGIIDMEDRLDELGKESIEVHGNEGDVVFQRESEEIGSKEKISKNQDVTLESNIESPAQVKQFLSVSDGSKENDQKSKKTFQDTMKRFISEMAAGETSDLSGNPHVVQAQIYNDLGRRFVPQYKYTGAFKNIAAEAENDLIPEKAPPELVLVVAKESALLGPDKSMDLGSGVDRKKILRSGDYWNGVWKEEVDIKKASRSATQKKVLGSIKAKIKPGSDFYKVVSRMKKISPRLLYIINKKQL